MHVDVVKQLQRQYNYICYNLHMLQPTKCYNLQNATTYRMLPLTKCYNLQNVTIYKMLQLTECYNLQNVTTYNMLQHYYIKPGFEHIF